AATVIYLFSYDAAPGDLHSLPTRRSSDLNPAGSFAKLSSLGFVTGGLGIIPSTTPGYPEYVPQIYFNNFQIGVPTLNTYQPNNRSEEHTSELQSRRDLVCRLLLEKKNIRK